MASTNRLKEQISSMMLGGATLERVDREVIGPSDLSPDRKAALWLWVLSYVRGAEQRAPSVAVRLGFPAPWDA